MKISKEAVEAAARVVREKSLYSNYYPTFDAIKTILEAAAPHMLAGAWDDGHSAGVDHADGLSGGSNPYDRPTP